MKRALIVVDPQNDFMPGGSLAVKDGDQIVPVINKLTKSGMYDLVIFTKDWHPADMKAFASQHSGKNPFDTYVNDNGDVDVLWPDHCVAGTEGAEFHKDIDLNIPNLYLFKKGLEVNSHPYSGFGDLYHFDSSGLVEFLKERTVSEVYIAGLALDYCVRDTTIDAINQGFKTNLILDGTRTITEDGGNKTIKDLSDMGVVITDSKTVLTQ